MLKWFKKIKNKFMYSLDELAQTRDFIMGKRYQWINTPDDNKVASITEVRDVFQRGSTLMVSLSDGTSVTVDQLNSQLMVIMDDQQPLTKAEALSIRGPVAQKPQKPKAEAAAAPAVPAETAAVTKADPQVTSQNLFSMFATEESLLQLNLRVNLPATSLLKMMYKSSQNKSDFLTQLSEHINNQIKQDHIKDALLKKLDSK